MTAFSTAALSLTTTRLLAGAVARGLAAREAPAGERGCAAPVLGRGCTGPALGRDFTPSVLGRGCIPSVPGRGCTAPMSASDAGVPGPVEAHADSRSTAASRYESSARPRQIAGYMALLIEDVPAVSRVPEGPSSVRKLCATKNQTLGISHSHRPAAEVMAPARETPTPRK